MDPFQKKFHVLVTGAAGGVGLALIQSYLARYPNAVITAQIHKKKLSDSLPEDFLTQHQARIFEIQADATDEKSVENAFQAANKAFGVVDILVANHAVFPSEDIDLVDMSLDQFQNTLSINLTGVFLFARQFLRQLRTACLKPEFVEKLKTYRPSIIVIGSTSGIFGERGHVDYSCSKSALIYGFTKSIKNEIVKIAPLGRINTVSPGWIRTPLAEENIKRGDHFQALLTTPLKKIATCDDVCQSVMFLGDGDLSGHLTGLNVELTGGMEGRVLNKIEDFQK